MRAVRERDLRLGLNELHRAIDNYKDYADLGYLGPQKLGTNNWPETLDVLVDGVKLPGPDGKNMRFLRRIPVDPFTGKAEWGMRSDQDDPKSQSWGGQCVFDVYSKTKEKAAMARRTRNGDGAGIESNRRRGITMVELIVTLHDHDHACRDVGAAGAFQGPGEQGARSDQCASRDARRYRQV